VSIKTRKGNNKGCTVKPLKRLSIYLRDGLACVYCGASTETGAQLTLDHVKPACQGGTNEATNLVTACRKCNCSRQDRSVASFCEAVAEYVKDGRTGKQIAAHVHKTRKRVVKVEEARDLIARRLFVNGELVK
jgi:hypothetical protein